MSLNNAQNHALVWIPRVTAPLSIVGSLCIVYMAARKLRARSSQPTKDRMMIGLSLTDIINSVALGLTTLPMPSDSGRLGAHGTVGTCEAQGFFLQFGYAALFYNVSLMIYFTLTIRYGLSDQVMSTKIEPHLHTISILFPFAIAVSGIPLKLYNPRTFTCWITEIPYGCDDDPDVDCERGNNSRTFILLYSVIPTYMLILVLFGSLFLICWTVLESERRRQRWSFNREDQSMQSKRKIRAIACRSFMYAIIFFNTYVWVLISNTILVSGKKQILSELGFPFAVLGQIFFPLQGFFAFLVYVHPRLQQVRNDAGDDASTLWVIKEAIFGQPPPPHCARSSMRPSIIAPAKPPSKNSSSFASHNSDVRQIRDAVIFSSGEEMESSMDLPQDFSPQDHLDFTDRVEECTSSKEALFGQGLVSDESADEEGSGGSLILVGTIPHLLHVRMGEKKQKSSRKYELEFSPTSWPDSLPLQYEDKIFSVVCGNTHIKWCVHDSSATNFNPGCCWRTRHLTPDDLDEGPPTFVLSKHLPQAPSILLFGRYDAEGATKETVLQHSYGRMGTVITVYIISTNMEQAQRVAWCFGEIPCRIYMMQPDDFYTEEQGRYPNMGVDRLAGLKATEQITGYPCLVIDGGTCLTYASCDDKGHIKGGGISLGLLARFAAISGQTEQSPGMEDVSSAELMLERAHAMVEAGHPLEFFCRNTQDAVISTALREYASSCREIIRKFVLGMREQGLTQKFGGADKAEVEVVVAGGDGEILSRLLAPDSSLLEPADPSIPPVKIRVVKHLLAFGIAHTLTEKLKEYNGPDVSELDKLVLGCRIAKPFEGRPDEDGDPIYRGTVAASVREGTQTTSYIVIYDDMDSEEFDFGELYEGLTLYSRVGEKVSGKPEKDELHQVLEQKRVNAEGAALLLQEQKKVAPSENTVDLPSANEPEKGKEPTIADTPGYKRTPPAKVSASKSKKQKPDPHSFVGRRIAKHFDNDIFFGTVSKYDEFWFIDYDDGDDEEFDENDLKRALELYEENKDLDREGGNEAQD